MASLPRSARRDILRAPTVLAIDALCAAFSLWFALYLRIGSNQPARMVEGLTDALPIMVAVSLVVFSALGLYRRAWRSISATDSIFIVEAATLAIAGFLVCLVLLGWTGWMPRSLPIIHWFVLVALLCGTRVTRRIMGEYLSRLRAPDRGSRPHRQPQRALLVGPGDRVDLVLRLLAGNQEAEFKLVGILDESGRHQGLRLRGVPVLGSVDALEHAIARLAAEGQRPDYLIMASMPERLTGSTMVQTVTRAEAMGLKVAYFPRLTNLREAGQRNLDLQFINVSDLIGRPESRLDNPAVSRTIGGRRVLVTGAGGTIGRELVRQIARLKPAQIILLESSEINLYEVDQELGDHHPDLPRVPVLCSIRQRRQVMQVFEAHRPELVFHAAALKHVPLVEQHVCAGVQTNVIGTRNVADAAKRYGVVAMVQVSTDKAVNPVGMMGATKRLGELYCQALDLQGRSETFSPRFLTVRFGNVLGSSGSLIPLFQRQLSRGDPLTVTHPDITRYFMTVHEAVQLILQATVHGLEGDVARGRIFVLDMGAPIKIIEIAKRMLRLSGLDPDAPDMIKIVGLRPGEKLYEELFDERERRLPSRLAGVFEAEPTPLPLDFLRAQFERLTAASHRNDTAAVRKIIAGLLSESTDSLPSSTISPVKTEATSTLRPVLAH